MEKYITNAARIKEATRYACAIINEHICIYPNTFTPRKLCCSVFLNIFIVVKVKSSKKMVMIVWLTAAYKKLDIRSNLVINFDLCDGPKQSPYLCWKLSLVAITTTLTYTGSEETPPTWFQWKVPETPDHLTNLRAIGENLWLLECVDTIGTSQPSSVTFWPFEHVELAAEVIGGMKSLIGCTAKLIGAQELTWEKKVKALEPVTTVSMTSPI